MGVFLTLDIVPYALRMIFKVSAEWHLLKLVIPAKAGIYLKYGTVYLAWMPGQARNDEMEEVV
ncbi:MAG: hypothetical protein ACI8VC_002229 [Candidatus Endobugula sp.]|jgi:hypothetical protein